ncbi:MAG: SDR family oxidoreductase [Saprospiraceae bacterium]|jgi:NAD(P)-dependent dehydrogenase (short-subunit alcohol dehydrogenase family)|nr:SDR family oxidoreductase [Saprospiraceae bacterium]MBK6481205.1 SDR family oxidoreductase [Saprospiraceae bacterium]MBK6817901.1 SDR family oxidoreductase [Saprospiraceae bacterium]MBK7370856.1 SDR family oxidoreductase [Saprospiraceae bacterium]MBK7436599.1 SDR family oxidoreductase [Saprospiraceae bacterium]
MNHLAGKVMYITGGTKGIGLGILKEALNHGMKVAVSARNIDTLDTTAFSKDNFLLLHSDVKKAEDEQAAVAKIKAQWGQLDVLIANAGVGHFVPIDQMTSAQWHDTIDTNLTGVFNSVQAAIPMLKESQGYIITVASLAGTNFFPQASAYNASKFGLVGFSQAIMLDLRPFKIKVTTIMPGSVATYFNNHIPDEKDAWKIQPEDIGKLVIDLLTMNPRTLPSKIEVRPSQTS